MRQAFRFALGFGLVLLINYAVWDIPTRAGVRTSGRPQ
jgi:hypothetical protein